MKKRLVASHRMNASSSRSHCIFTLYLEQKPAHDPEQIITSKLSLVDLVRNAATIGEKRERERLCGAGSAVGCLRIVLTVALFLMLVVVIRLALSVWL